MMNLIKNLKTKVVNKYGIGFLVLVVFVLLVGQGVNAWFNKPTVEQERQPEVLGDSAKVEPSANQILVKELLAAELNLETSEISMIVSSENETNISGLVIFDSPSRSQGFNFTAQKINEEWRLTAFDNGLY